MIKYTRPTIKLKNKNKHCPHKSYVIKYRKIPNRVSQTSYHNNVSRPCIKISESKISQAENCGVPCSHHELFPLLPEVPETKTENCKHEA